MSRGLCPAVAHCRAAGADKFSKACCGEAIKLADEVCVGQRSETSPVRISTMSLASWFVSRGRFTPVVALGIVIRAGTGVEFFWPASLLPSALAAPLGILITLGAKSENSLSDMPALHQSGCCWQACSP